MRLMLLPLLALLTAHAGADDSAPSIEEIRQRYNWPTGSDFVPPQEETDCEVAKLAYEYALHLHPELAPLRTLFDALELNTKCDVAVPAPGPARDPVSFPLPAKGGVFVDGKHGDDAATGTEAEPLKTLGSALGKVQPQGTVVLRAGVHFVGSTLKLEAVKHKDITLQNYPKEDAWISGGVPIYPEWLPGAGGAPVGAGATNVFHAKLPDVASMMGLNRVEQADPGCQLDSCSRLHAKMVRARAPNKVISAGTMERGLFGGTGATWHKPPGWGYPNFNISRSVYMDKPTSAASTLSGQHFTYGVGGETCARFTPAGGFWCSNRSGGGGSGWELMVPGAPLFPVSLEIDVAKVFGSTVVDPSTWVNKSSAVIETWTNGWSTTFWEVDDIASNSGPGGRNATFVFGNGGQQSGRGFHIDPPVPVHGASGPINTEGGWKIENAIELLDAPEEYFFDEVTRTLYLVHNGTGPPPSDGWIVPTLKTLLDITGTQSDPIEGVTLQGLGFRDSQYTYLDEWGIPAGGDWALHRGGALFVEGAKRLTIDQCSFTLLDGNAVFFSGYTRNCSVSNSSFTHIGDNAMASWGYTEDTKEGIAAGHALPKGTGVDGTGGEQPRYTSIVGNVVREIGLNERQSSAWSEAKACLSHVKGNLIYNIPRAAINMDDGFGGGTVIEENLLTNTCRESGDHGPFNSWDRQPFLTDVRDGTPSIIPLNNTIRKNFFVSNYGAGFGVDNDDTSSYYDINSNFFYLGGGVKCDYDGHEKYFYNNLLLGTTAGCWHTCAYKKGFPDHCFDNTFVQAENPTPRPGQPVVPPFAIIWFCDAKNVSHILPDYDNEVQMGDFIYGNKVLNSKAEATVTCGYSGPSSSTTVPLSDFTAAGLMKGTTVGVAPPDAEVLDMARVLLGMR